MNILIATSRRFVDLSVAFQMLQESAIEGGLTLHGMVAAPGPGCNNYAFRLSGDEAEIERFANQLTMVLMPSKWTTTSDEIPDGITQQ